MGAGENTSALSYTELFYQCLPHYLAMGMSADEFWNCDPRMYRVYREMDRINNERKNELLWINGIYMTRAITACLSKDGDPYPTEPFKLGLSPQEEEEATVEEIQKSKQFATVMNWALTVNKQKEKENGRRTGNTASNTGEPQNQS